MRRGEQTNGPQQSVNAIASSDFQPKGVWESHAAHVTANAASSEDAERRASCSWDVRFARSEASSATRAGILCTAGQAPRRRRNLRERVREIIGKQQSGKDVKQLIAELTPVLRGWGNYFRTGNADRKFNHMDSFVGPVFVVGSGGGADSGPRSVHVLRANNFTAWASIG